MGHLRQSLQRQVQCFLHLEHVGDFRTCRKSNFYDDIYFLHFLLQLYLSAIIVQYDRPSGMGNYNTEGFAIAPANQYCDGNSAYSPSSPSSSSTGGVSGAVKAVFWADDDCTNGHALRRGTVKCGEFI